MKKVDKIFLKMFRDLRIELNPVNAGTPEEPNFICYLENKPFSYKHVVLMVKRYQEEIIKEMLLETENNEVDSEG